jgi:hypothetical protein
LAKGTFPEGLWEEVLEHLKGVEKATGKKFGDARNPLLFSVRSGAPLSMPGMMDTVLNLGMNDEVANGLSKLTKDERFVYDAYRRFITMFADVVMGAERKEFDKVHEAWKEKEGAKSDPELSVKALKEVVTEQKKLFKIHFRNVNQPLPHFVETFIDGGYFDMYKVVKALRHVDFDGVLIADHIPMMADDHRLGTSFTIGYMKALVERVNAEAQPS